MVVPWIWICDATTPNDFCFEKNFDVVSQYEDERKKVVFSAPA